MSLVRDFLKPHFSADALEGAKECCRSVVETLDPDSINHKSWEDVCLSLWMASLVKGCGADLDNLIPDIAGVAPQSGNGSWSIESMKLHPRREIFFEELKLVEGLLLSLPDMLRVRACGGLYQHDRHVLSDINKLLWNLAPAKNPKVQA